MITPEQLARRTAQGRLVLKRDHIATVELIGPGDNMVVVKTYHNAGIRLLQTFARSSRARREHDHLRALFDEGVPCLEPIGWIERRRFGLVSESQLVTRLSPQCRSLKQALTSLRSDGHHRTRARLVAAMGSLVGDLHRRGVLWSTPMPRNVLVVGEPADARLAVSDTPACIMVGRSLHGGHLASIDLFLGAFSPSRRRDFTTTERLRWLRAYCGGDRALLRRLWRRQNRRRRPYNELLRALAMTWFTYVRRSANCSQRTRSARQALEISP